MNRREFGKLALAGIPAAALIENPLFGAVLAQAKPNSKFAGVQIGTITYSYRSMQDQGAEATLKYTVDSGISGIELMGGPVNDWARKMGKFDASPAGAAAAVAAARAGGAGGAGGGGGRGGGRGAGAPGAPGAEAGGRGAAPAAAAGMQT